MNAENLLQIAEQIELSEGILTKEMTEEVAKALRESVKEIERLQEHAKTLYERNIEIERRAERSQEAYFRKCEEIEAMMDDCVPKKELEPTKEWIREMKRLEALDEITEETFSTKRLREGYYPMLYKKRIDHYGTQFPEEPVDVMGLNMLASYGETLEPRVFGKIAREIGFLRFMLITACEKIDQLEKAKSAKEKKEVWVVSQIKIEKLGMIKEETEAYKKWREKVAAGYRGAFGGKPVAPEPQYEMVPYKGEVPRIIHISLEDPTEKFKDQILKSGWYDRHYHVFIDKIQLDTDGEIEIAGHTVMQKYS